MMASQSNSSSMGKLGEFLKSERLTAHMFWSSHCSGYKVICLLLAPSAGEPILCMPSMPVRNSHRKLAERVYGSG